MEDSFIARCVICGKERASCMCGMTSTPTGGHTFTGFCPSCGKSFADCMCIRMPDWAYTKHLLADLEPRSTPTQYPTKPMLYVRWVDIMDYGDKAPMSIAKEGQLAIMETCGFLIDEDDETLTLDQHIIHITEVPEPTVQNYTVIPKVLIKESRVCNLGMMVINGELDK